MTRSDIVLDDFTAIKDPAEILDYTIYYEALLLESMPPDSIVASTWTIEAIATGAQLTILSESFTGVDATVWISAGGKTNTHHRLVNHVTTASSREYERTITVWIMTK